MLIRKPGQLLRLFLFVRLPILHLNLLISEKNVNLVCVKIKP